MTRSPTLDRDALRALAERIERMESSGDIHLVADIYEALGYEVKREPKRSSGVGRFTAAWKWFDPTTRRWMAMAHFTASLDAAMTLVPEGYAWECGSDNDGRHAATCSPTGDDMGDCIFAATPALALTAAALRSLAGDVS